MANSIEIKRRRALQTEPAPTFHIKEIEIQNSHQFQVFIDFGKAPGPWLVFGFNNKAWGLGYLPKERTDG